MCAPDSAAELVNRGRVVSPPAGWDHDGRSALMYAAQCPQAPPPAPPPPHCRQGHAPRHMGGMSASIGGGGTLNGASDGGGGGACAPATVRRCGRSWTSVRTPHGRPWGGGSPPPATLWSQGHAMPTPTPLPSASLSPPPGVPQGPPGARGDGGPAGRADGADARSAAGPHRRPPHPPPPSHRHPAEGGGGGTGKVTLGRHGTVEAPLQFLVMGFPRPAG